MADPQDFFDLLNVHSRGIFTKGTVKDSLLAYWTLGAFGNELVAAPVEEPPGVGYGGRRSLRGVREPRRRKGANLLLLVHLTV